MTRPRTPEEYELLESAIGRAIADSIAEGIYAVDADCLLTFMNPAGEALLRCEMEHVVGINLPSIVHRTDAQGKDRHDTPNPVLLVLKSSAPILIDSTVFYRPDGSEFPASCTACPIVEDGITTGVVVAFRDITERQRLEQDLRQLHKMEAIGQLAGGVAHDFNNLLTIINGNASLLMADTSSTEKVRKLAQPIYAAGERAAQLTQRLLAFSRRQVLEPKVISINGAVAEIEPIVRRLLPEDIQIITRLDPSAGQVTVDPGQLEQIVLNLAVNARDAMGRGGRLTIETQRIEITRALAGRPNSPGPGTYALLCVNDTGAGMDSSTMSHIFEPFFTTKGSALGTGLGLAVVYGVVRQSGGYISVYSEPGLGTCFKIYLPSTQSEPLAIAQRPERERGVRSETVLLVEDDIGVRQYVQTVLESYGYRVLAVDDADAAVTFGETFTEHIDLLLTDVVMPFRNGPEVARELVRLRPSLKVLYMSGYTSDMIVRHGVLSPEHNFLSKPFSPVALDEKICQVLQKDHRLPMVALVDEETSFPAFLQEVFGWAGYNILRAQGAEDAVQACRSGQADLFVAHLADEHGSGCQTVRLLREGSPDTPVIALCDGSHHVACTDCFDVDAVFTRPLAVEELLRMVGSLLTGRAVESDLRP